MQSSEFIEWVNSFGVFGPIIYILAQIVQILIMPIPGQVVGAAGGYLFGWWGVLWTFIGTAIGGFLVFWLSRKLGRPFVEKLIKKSDMHKFDFIFNKNAPFILFIIFLLPGLPDDFVCLLAGLTNVPIKTLMVVLLLGKIPTIIATNYIGAGLSQDQLGPVIAVVIGMVVLLALCYWQKPRILKFLDQLSQKPPKTS